MADDWEPGPTRSRLLSQLLARPGGGRAPRWALLAALAALAAFVAAVLLDWMVVSLDIDQLNDAVQNDTGSGRISTATLGIGSVQQLSVAYLTGTLGLLVLVGLILTDARGARRLQLAAAGLAVGLLAIVAAIVHDAASGLISTTSSLVYGGVNSSFVDAARDATEVSLGPGLFCGVAAEILLLLAAIGGGLREDGEIAGAVIDVPRQPSGVRPVQAPGEPAVPAATTGPAGASVLGPAARITRPVGQIGDLSVGSADVIDLGTDGDVLGPDRRRPQR